MKLPAVVASATLLLGGSWLFGQVPTGPAAFGREAAAPFPDGYLGHEALTAALKRAAADAPRTLRVESLAKTAQGRDVWLATLGRPLAANEARPAILVVANLEADHVVGSQVALRMIERLARDADRDPAVARLLDRTTIHVVPRLNPDGAERLLTGSPRLDSRLNAASIDRDRDGRTNEDGPDDLDGDGLLTRMRARDGKATLVADDRDPRILRKADPGKGERPVYSEYTEGTDDDGDGQVNEDPPGGVNLNRNWPHGWTELDPEAGWSPASEPEVRGLIRFAFDHPEIVAVWTFGLNDNLRAEPRKPGSSLDDADLPLFADLSRRYNRLAPASPPPAGAREPEKPAARPAEPKAEPADRPVAPTAEERGRLADRFKGAGPEERAKIAGQLRTGRGVRGPGAGGPPAAGAPAPASEPAGGLAGTTDGALSEWAYHQFGVVGLASRLWPGPDIPEPAKGQPAPPADGEARWLDWNDHVVGGRAFAPLKAVDHPTLGKVEVGGWKPGVRVNPPASRIDAIADGQVAFLKELAGRVPRLEIADAKAVAKGGGLYEVTAAVVNTGPWPTALAQGVRTRKAPLVLVRLRAGPAKILAGRPLYRFDNLAGSGGRREFRWLILAPEGMNDLSVEATSPKAGRPAKTIRLKGEVGQ